MTDHQIISGLVYAAALALGLCGVWAIDRAITIIENAIKRNDRRHHER